MSNDPTRASDIQWQEMGGLTGLVCCAAVGGTGTTLCGSRVFDPAVLNQAGPTFTPLRVACPACTKRLFESLSQDEFLLLPMEVLGADISVRAVTIAKRLFGRQWVTLGDLTGVKPETVFRVPSCGVTTVGVLSYALGLYGLGLALGADEIQDRRRVGSFKDVAKGMLLQLRATAKEEAWRIRSEHARQVSRSRFTDKQARHDAVVTRFAEKVGLDLLKIGTIDQVAERVGLSPGRVRQLLKKHPTLRQLRGDTPLRARREQRAEAALKAAQPTPREVEDLARWDSVVEIAVYARGHSLSFSAACKILGRSQPVESANKTKLRPAHPEVLEDPLLKKILDPRAFIGEEAALAKKRIIEDGMSLQEALVGLESCPQSIERRLRRDRQLLEHNRKTKLREHTKRQVAA